MTSYHKQALDLAGSWKTRLDLFLNTLASRGQNGSIYPLYSDYRSIARNLLDDPQALKAYSSSFLVSSKEKIGGLVEDAVMLGEAAASEQTALFGTKVPVHHRGYVPARDKAAVVSAAAGIIGNQLNMIDLQVRIGNTDPDTVLGTDLNPRLWNPSALVRELSVWLPSIMFMAYEKFVSTSIAGSPLGPFVKQAYALVDSRTTLTCLEVNGQTKLFSEPFELGGEFPGLKQFPPFHYWCRTVTALIPLQMLVEAITDALVSEGLSVVAARSAGKV